MNLSSVANEFVGTVEKVDLDHLNLMKCSH